MARSIEPKKKKDMKGYIFPGQGAQYEGMGKELYDSSPAGKAFFEQANYILGYRLSDVMFTGTTEELKETKITQPALFVHSLASLALTDKAFDPDMVAGHSLGEFSALVAAKALSFEDGLRLVKARALAMQKACELEPSTMAAIVGLEDKVVEDICVSIGDVVPANYNSPGQLVISGSIAGINKAVEQMKEAGAKRAIILVVGGAFHSPFMAPAKEELAKAIDATDFSVPICPIYQNVSAMPSTDPEEIKANLIEQLTAPVKWTQLIQKMVEDGVTEMVECGGNGKVLRGLMRRINRAIPTNPL